MSMEPDGATSEKPALILAACTRPGVGPSITDSPGRPRRPGGLGVLTIEPE